MFTGIVQATGRVESVESSPDGRRLVISTGSWGHTPSPGDSICVSGCCLTLARQVGADGFLQFDAIPETLDKTTLGGFEAGSRVNLERSVTASTLMDGHVVQGHVEGVGVVIGVERGDGWRVRIEPPRDLMPCVVPKGSVTLDGVSLTVAAVEPGEGWFEVALIPTTLDLTTLGDLEIGSGINVETDIFARTVVHVMRNYRSVLDD